MDFIIGRIVIGVLAGALSACAVDVNAWVKAGAKFDWPLALKRWLAGAITGASAAFGVTVSGV